MPTMEFTYQLSAPSESVSEHPNISNIASQSRRKSDGEWMANGGVCGDWSISALWMGGVVGDISCRGCGITGNDVFNISAGRTSKHALLRGSRGPAGFRRRARRWCGFSPYSMSALGAFTGDEDGDEMVESDDSVEVVERRVDLRDKPGR